jgi:hypothetical protein
MKYEHIRVPAVSDEAMINRLGAEGWLVVTSYTDQNRYSWLMFCREVQADPCLAKAYPNEPTFTLRAKDSLAPNIVLEWIKQARAAGVNEPKIVDAERVYTAMCYWQKDHGAHYLD